MYFNTIYSASIAIIEPFSFQVPNRICSTHRLSKSYPFEFPPTEPRKVRPQRPRAAAHSSTDQTAPMQGLNPDSSTQPQPHSLRTSGGTGIQPKANLATYYQARRSHIHLLYGTTQPNRPTNQPTNHDNHAKLVPR
ncbi:hypothetical protein BDW66DRAFT_78184 [Aspergillus desertorum]